ncbi:S1C family serine protease [Virgibacillus sp. MSJ-26]|uniref:S1C family serine protease n=1 Tax=Virgibacillus sp. MSJ-26 TaxID=2841522 RepID=UPI001C110A06|nr:S1C family serine protease [Virgibacillus sp. MSJ-26]MBU5467536.1 S1C family serine protease [Virgibacillus sp. MSJ-26]
MEFDEKNNNQEQNGELKEDDTDQTDKETSPTDPVQSTHQNLEDDESNHQEHITETDNTSEYTHSDEETSENHSFNQTENEHHVPNPPQKHKTKKRHIGISALIGGLTGGIIATLTVLLLFSNQIISFDDSAPASQSEQQSDSQPVSINVSDDDDLSTDVEETSKAVVGVSRLQKENIWEPNQETGTGSGIIYKKEDGKAYVVTNHHVVDGAEELEITLNNDETIPGKVLGSDELADLAILEIDGSKIDTVAKLGSSEDLNVGETVIAIGNPLGLEFSNSLTKGIVSGVNRSVSVDTTGDRQPDWTTEVIQTDAAINPGNSGGALINTEGEVIGINSMKIAEQAVEGIGFAIPIDSAKPLMEQLETDGEIARPYVGISAAALEEVPPAYQENIALPKDVKDGLVIANVEAGSPADKAGLQQFDVITKINGEDVTSFLDLRKFLYDKANIGEKIKINYYRNGEKDTANLELTKRIADEY